MTDLQPGTVACINPATDEVGLYRLYRLADNWLWYELREAVSGGLSQVELDRLGQVVYLRRQPEHEPTAAERATKAAMDLAKHGAIPLSEIMSAVRAFSLDDYARRVVGAAKAWRRDWPEVAPPGAVALPADTYLAAAVDALLAAEAGADV